jgi:hypothetical protein
MSVDEFISFLQNSVYLCLYFLTETFRTRYVNTLPFNDREVEWHALRSWQRINGVVSHVK